MMRPLALVTTLAVLVGGCRETPAAEGSPGSVAAARVAQTCWSEQPPIIR